MNLLKKLILFEFINKSKTDFYSTNKFTINVNKLKKKAKKKKKKQILKKIILIKSKNKF